MFLVHLNVLGDVTKTRFLAGGRQRSSSDGTLQHERFSTPSGGGQENGCYNKKQCILFHTVSFFHAFLRLPRVFE